jgi:hypothetical protein
MVKHITKDGRQLNSVSGIVIGSNQFPQIYKVIEQIEKRGKTESDRKMETSKGL